MPIKRLLLSAACLTALPCAPAHAESINGLGDLPGGLTQSNPFGISADGSVVAGWSYSASGAEGFIWTSGSMVGLGDLAGGSFQSNMLGISGDGLTLVGNGTSASGGEAAIWTSGGGLVGLGDLAGGAFGSAAYAASFDGSVVVGYGISAAGQEAFRWTSGGGMIGLGDMAGGAFYRNAQDVSDDGTIIVGVGGSASGTEAFRWTSGGGMVGLGDLPGGIFFSSAFGISGDGNVIVGYGSSAGGSEAMRWTSGGGMVALGDLPGGLFNSRAYDASQDGSVIVGYGNTAAGQRAFVWNSTDGIQDLATVLTAAGVDMTGFTLTAAYAVDPTGNIIVGTQNFTQGFIANLSSGGLSTIEEITESLVPALTSARMAQTALSTATGQSLFAATGMLTSLQPRIIDTSNPAAIAPAAGEASFDPLWSAYAVGTFGLGPSNDMDNFEINGTTGLALQLDDDLAFGFGIAGSTARTETLFEGESRLHAFGPSLLAAYEPASGLRLYGSAFAARLEAETDRRYGNGAGFDTSQGESDGFGYGAAIRAGWEFPVRAQTTWMPYGELSASRTTLDGYTETGGGFPAVFGEQTSTEVTSRLGFQVDHDLSGTLTIGGRAAWAHRIKEGDGGLSASTTGFSGTLSNEASDRDWGEAALTASWQPVPGTHLSAELSGRSGRTHDPAAALTIGFKIGF